MSSEVFVERIEVSNPVQAARRGAAVALASCGPGRVTLIIHVGDGDGPGLTIAPWTLDGALGTARTLELDVYADSIGAADPAVPASRPWSQYGVPSSPHDGTLSLVVPGARHAMSIPNAWVGAHACVLAPCIRNPTLSNPTRAGGPASHALARLASACTRESLREPVAVGAWLASHLFASVGVLIDATWSATLGEPVPELRATEYIFAATALNAATIDETIDKTIAPQPSASLAAPLAARSVTALWRQRAAQPIVPGRLASAWSRYTKSIVGDSP